MADSTRRNGPVLLTILDGWGYRAETHGNAIAIARKPHYDRLLREYPNTLIRASEHFVGLPDGQMGNSEVGHLNLGAGRVVRLDITRIDAAIASGEFFEDPTLLKALRAMVTGSAEGGAYADPIARVHESYNNGITDEFIEPFVCVDANGEPIAKISDGDAVICFNYRADRVRQITRVLARRSGLAADGGMSLPKAAELDAEIP